MDLVIFVGIPASGKSSFYKEHFFRTHVRVNMDMLHTRRREDGLLDFCFQTSQPLVVDNTNVSIRDRQKYIALGKQYRFKIRGYYFQSIPKECMARNASRIGKERIEEKGVLGKFRQLQLPSFAEGFDELYYVRLQDQQFLVSPWQTDSTHEV